MTDIVTRLRRWTISTEAVPASDMMDAAADEIERLRAEVLRWQCEVSGLLRARSYEKGHEKHVFCDMKNATGVADAWVAAVRASSNHDAAKPTSPPGSEQRPDKPCRSESQSPASECGGGEPLDDTRPDTKGEATGGRGHFPDSRTENATLSDAERAAIAHAADLLIGSRHGATLRGLLERTQTVKK